MNSVKDIYEFLNKMAPFKLSEKWDNCGLIIGNLENTVKCCMFVLDITEQVIEKSIQNNCNLIITHHPVIFHPLKNITSNCIVHKLIQNDISVISAHTNLDKAERGTSQILSEKLKLRNIRTIDCSNKQKYYKIIVYVPNQSVDIVFNSMALNGAGAFENYSECAFKTEGIGCFRPNENANPHIGSKNKLENVNEIKLEMLCAENNIDAVINAMKEAHPYESIAYDIFENKAITKNYGFCKMGELEDSMNIDEFAKFVKKTLDVPYLKYCDGKDTVKNVAVVAGGGGSIIQVAIDNNADAFISGDIKHDMFVSALEKKISLIDIGHYESEIIVFFEIIKHFRKQFKDITFEILDDNFRPIKYIFNRR